MPNSITPSPLYIPRKTYQAPNAAILRSAFERAGVKDSDAITEAINDVFRKMNVDEKLNYEAIERWARNQACLVIINFYVEGPMDGHDSDEEIVGVISELPVGTQLLGIDWSFVKGQGPTTGVDEDNCMQIVLTQDAPAFERIATLATNDNVGHTIWIAHYPDDIVYSGVDYVELFEEDVFLTGEGEELVVKIGPVHTGDWATPWPGEGLNIAVRLLMPMPHIRRFPLLEE